MKLIIVCIDFSRASMHALEYAIFLANMVKANVTMIWVDNQTGVEYVFSDGGTELREETKRNFEEIVNTYRDKLKHGSLKYRLRKGKVYFEIAQQARQLKADLIITGTHGVTGYEEFWIGSNAYRIVTSSPCPIITIRQQYDFSKGINNIVLPIDHTRNTNEKVPFTLILAKLFDARINLLALYFTGLKSLRKKVDNSAKKVKTLIADQGIECNCTSRNADNITQTILEFSDEVDSDLIMIMTEQETTVANILLGEYARQMVNYSSVPVLSIHPSGI